ncbi:MAG: flavin reductase family protein, partial [Flavobacteriia bacterium]|nr:flavin reductase family protein [Flavobacteriia bacterium]
MIHLKPEELNIPDLQRTLQFAVGPRPIALVSTVDRDGRVNLSPFSFYNVFRTTIRILINDYENAKIREKIENEL